MDHIDTGERCEAHVGEVFPPRCNDCETERATAHPQVPRCGYFPGTECPSHRERPLPCDRCAEDGEDDMNSQPRQPEVEYAQ